MEAKLHNRLLDSKWLIHRADEYKLLKLPFRFALIFQSLTADVVSKVDWSDYRGNIFFRDFTAPGKSHGKGYNEADLLHDLFENTRYSGIHDFSSMTSEEVNDIIERLAPDYLIITTTQEQVAVTVTNCAHGEEAITGQEHQFISFALDDEQVDMVNQIRKGHQVILANAGAGKGVILLSKAYRLADIYPEEKVMLTCYNRNLAQSYQFRADIAGFWNKRESAHLHLPQVH